MNKNHANDTDRLAGSAPMKSSVSNSKEEADQMNKSSIATAHEYWNLTNEQVIMRDRYGMTMVIDPTNSKDRKPTTREFIIFEHLMVGDGCTFDMSGIKLGNNPEESDEHLAVMKRTDFEAWEETRRTRGGRPTDVIRKRYKTVITAADLQRGVYVPSIDRVLYLATAKHIYHHPESVVGRLLAKKSTGGSFTGFNFSVEIFDGKGNITERWAKHGKFSFRIPINREGIEPDGVRITCTGADNRVSEQFLSIEEATDQLGIFKSKEDADNFNEDAEMKRRNLELEKEIESLKNQTQKEAFENKRKEQFYERDKSERTYQYSREKSDTEHEQFREKSAYETSSMHRKNALEVIKFIPAVITAITGLILVFHKVNKKS